MGCKELIEALQRTRDEKIAAIWNEAKAEASKLRAEADERIEAARRSLETGFEAAAGKAAGRALYRAQGEARKILLGAERDITERLFAVAKSLLPELRRIDRERIFELLLRELPPLAWGEVSVHPDDAALARRLLPGARINPAGDVSGGMEAESADRAVRVVNTFEKRLERCRRELLPQMMREVYERLSLH